VTGDNDAPLWPQEEDWQRFYAIETMVNHWDRPDWWPGRADCRAGVTAYYVLLGLVVAVRAARFIRRADLVGIECELRVVGVAVSGLAA